ncbi:12573_t:CDS:2 [Cetraspora pellucida]|uniref:12573_t:CDS:1 n=1 Tax=Cetraspora pellucida TaxID=1433469 RepID=A0A9N9CPX1_9GLOM|nr:12573_t:CDS:2 [Cetraspora pellucida]
MASKEFSALEEKDIQPGDYVSTPFRGGTRQGYTKKIVKTNEEAKENPIVKRPPKVIFDDQHGHEVAHNPSTLSKDESKGKRDE